MDSDSIHSNGLVIRKAALDLNRVDSRLVSRGLVALEEVPKVRLEVLELIVFGASVFVLTKDWDPQATLRSRIFGSDAWKKHRRVILFEFHRSGVFLRKITMSLVEFSAQGYTAIRIRNPGRLLIRSQVVHFYEYVTIRRDQHWVEVRVDYLFSRDGKRLAVWSDSEEIDRMRNHNERHVPKCSGLKPEWVVDERLIAIEPRPESPGTSLRGASLPNELVSDDESLHYVVVSHNVAHWITLIAQIGESAEARSTNFIPSSVHTYNNVEFPAPRTLGPGVRYYGDLSDSSSDAGSVWFLEDRSRDDSLDRTQVWRMMLSNSEPIISDFALPHPYDLIRLGVLTLFDSEGNIWTPIQIATEPIYDDEDSDYSAVETHELIYERIYCWGDKLIAQIYDYQSASEPLILFHISNDQILPVKQLIFDGVRAFANENDSHVMPDGGNVEEDYIVKKYPDVPLVSDELLNHQGFADNHFFSIIWPGISHHGCIVVTNIADNSLVWFRPEVPATELM